ncbi:MAG: prepilin-type N-terminal cleavage/methylation domain-containing protein [Planctomycetota bacterium]
MCSTLTKKSPNKRFLRFVLYRKVPMRSVRGQSGMSLMEVLAALAIIS